jgi:hypothetical protein
MDYAYSAAHKQHTTRQTTKLYEVIFQEKRHATKISNIKEGAPI